MLREDRVAKPPTIRKQGIFISFEGSEGCGKSTQIQKLADTLKSRGISFVLTREPGGTQLGEKIRYLLKHTTDPISPEAELLLFATSRAQLVREVVQPTLANGTFVICDRFLDSTVVYQGIARNLSLEFIEHLNKYVIDNCIPDITFLLDMDAASALQRTALRQTTENFTDRMEQEPTEFYEEVRHGYLKQARKEPGRFVTLDARKTPGLLSQIIIETLEERWPSQLKTL